MEAINLLQCNPSTLKTTRTTCLPMPMLERLRDQWNKQFPAHRIPMTIKKKETLWAELRKRLRDQYKCATEYCAVEKLGEKGEAGKYFRPPKPGVWDKNPTEWHDSVTILNVMKQYEDAFPHFEFIGPTPIDFDEKLGFGSCVLDELCNLNLATVKAAGKTDIGIIFNLDPHDRPGSHWVCAYINLKKMEAYYYDSYGYEPGPQIRRLLRRCKEQGCRKIIWNDIRHQRKSSECGTYCMYVIISLLKDLPFTTLCKNRVEDDVINVIRDMVYATANPRGLAVAMAGRFLQL